MNEAPHPQRRQAAAPGEPTLDHVTVVVPTVGRESLHTLLLALAAAEGPRPAKLILVDDRPRPDHLDLPPMPFRTGTLRSYGHGPAAARNLGWRAADTEWIAFLDDDVIPGTGWFADLARDLDLVGGEDGGSQGRIEVPPPEDHAPTDAERRTAALADARWITADMAYRRDVLQAVGGFDDRFTRAFREDSDLALRVVDAGWRIAEGTRRTQHPARPKGFLSSVREQVGNADNALMRAKHGLTWRERCGERRSRFAFHLTTSVLGAAALYGTARRRRFAAPAAAAWAAMTGRFAASRIAHGPLRATEIADMALSSVLIPPAAVYWNVVGTLRHRVPPRPDAILFDRDDTLIEDGPYLNDPAKVTPLPEAALAMSRVRAAAIPTGVVSNQSGVARGLITEAELEAVNRRVDELLGPFETWKVCPHLDGCDCRKPSPRLILEAAEELGARPERCVMIGDIGADMEAAWAAGARAILVPTKRTRPEEVALARERGAVARDLCEAVNIALGDVA
ncbi:HAD-IIIA family hydrolase [Glycomyces sp. TRM65418]|uniref:HAD-IIIA family hydrolase n=1 Tax=Glycomyces sp. TRM65418 TaxID=2867006 RepID=UPI001CE6910E|nr:HAD-IIIA family hydrolase [Glycomyces sp. TRM65418]MCC3761863.1 HAD-IIIA family hydrolase [Glycomyces sp. TRM65418]QZD55944.1 HAD-IIIA family hydrolase [Glycomyces sp. TRM65418]